MPSFIDHHADAISALCRRFGVVRLDLFGSAAAGGFRPGHSDYDFLYELDPEVAGSKSQRVIGLAEGLEALLGAPVDLVNPRYIRNPYFSASVEATRRSLYARQPKAKASP